MVKKEALLVFMFVVVLQSVNGLGIGPAVTVINYDAAASTQEQVEFYVINDESSSLDVLLYGKGGFVDNVHFEEEDQTFTLVPGEEKYFIVYVDLEPGIEPGYHEAQIVAAQMPSGGAAGGETEITSLVSVAGRLGVFIPYPDQYLKITLDTDDTALGEPVIVQAKFSNLGLEPMPSYSGDVEIFDFKGDIVGSSSFSGSLVAGEHEDKRIEVALDGASPGEHTVKVRATYSGKEASGEATFMLGKMFIDILNYPKKMVQGEINIYEFDVKSNWNEPITGVYAELDIDTGGKKLTFKSENFDLESWEGKVVRVYVDLSEVEKGKYPAILSLHYGDTSTVEEFQMTVGSSFNMTFVYVGAGVVVLVVLFFIFRKRVGLFGKKRRKKK